jgi:hypothetical protein
MIINLIVSRSLTLILNGHKGLIGLLDFIKLLKLLL